MDTSFDQVGKVNGLASTITLAKPISLDLTCLYLLLLGILQDGVGVTYQYAEYITGNQILY